MPLVVTTSQLTQIEVDTREGIDTAAHWYDALAVMGLVSVAQEMTL